MAVETGFGKGFNTQSSYTPSNRQLTISWSDISVKAYEENSTHERQLLRSVSGIAKPGQMMAILGGSGAGKTTLLNIISGRLRSTTGSTTLSLDGIIYLNGFRVGARTDILKRVVAFVEQDDVFPGYLTVDEHLWFNAKLRMTGSTVTDQERRRRIDALLTELGLTLVKNTTIGYVEMGMKTLSGGERKRLSVATELLANAPLLLLDEPTTGLDSFTAESVISSLQRLAQLGKTVIFTIHQPSSELFAFFDRLYLMIEGHVCFCGGAKEAGDFFASPPIGRPCPISYNPADFYLEFLSRPYLGKKLDQNLLELEGANELELHGRFINKCFKESRYGQDLNRQLVELTKPSISNEEDDEIGAFVDSLAQPKPSQVTQFFWLSWRAAKTFYRSPQWMRIRVGQMVAYSLFFGLCYFDLSLSPRDVANRCGLCYVMLNWNCWDNVDAYSIALPFERNFVMRESQAGLYSLAAYFFGKQLIELPLIFLLGTIQTTAICLMSNFWITVTPAGIVQVIFTVFLAGVAASSLGYVIGFMADSMAISVHFRRTVAFVLVIVNGFYLNVNSVPPYFRWLVYLSFFFYSNSNVFIAEFGSVDHFDCADNDGDPNDKAICYPNGQAVLDYYSFGDNSTVPLNFAVLLINIVAWRALALFFLYYRSYGQVWKAAIKKTFRQLQGSSN